jgi:hypothetical protein
MNFYILLNIAKKAALEAPTIFFAPLLVDNERHQNISKANKSEKSQNRFIVRKHLKDTELLDFCVLKNPKYSSRHQMSTEDKLILSYEINKLKEIPDIENKFDPIVELITHGGGQVSIKPKRHSLFRKPSKKIHLVLKE